MEAEEKRNGGGGKEVGETNEYKLPGGMGGRQTKGECTLGEEIRKSSTQTESGVDGVNGVMETERGAVGWETMGLPNVNYAAEVRWNGREAQQRRLDAVQEQVGRKLLGGSRSVASCVVMGDLIIIREEGGADDEVPWQVEENGRDETDKEAL